MLCPVWVPKKVRVTPKSYDINGKAHNQPTVEERKVVICGKKPILMVRVHYRELKNWMNDGKMDDVFCLCSKHGPHLSTSSDYWVPIKNQDTVSGQRGAIERVELMPGDMAAIGQEDRNQRIASVKSEIKRRMRQANTRQLTLDHWRQVFTEAMDEYIVEGVINSSVNLRHGGVIFCEAMPEINCSFSNKSSGQNQVQNCGKQATKFVRVTHTGRLCALCDACLGNFERASAALSGDIKQNMPGQGAYTIVELADGAEEFAKQPPKA